VRARQLRNSRNSPYGTALTCRTRQRRLCRVLHCHLWHTVYTSGAVFAGPRAAALWIRLSLRQRAPAPPYASPMCARGGASPQPVEASLEPTRPKALPPPSCRVCVPSNTPPHNECATLTRARPQRISDKRVYGTRERQAHCGERGAGQQAKPIRRSGNEDLRHLASLPLWSAPVRPLCGGSAGVDHPGTDPAHRSQPVGAAMVGLIANADVSRRKS
jgi:hypothetical protein